jgi:hypothetical protein
MHGSIEIRPGEPPAWKADPDIANSSAMLPTFRYCVEETRSGASVSLETKPGFVIVRLGSDLGPIELAMTPQDAGTLTSLFAPCTGV